MPELTPRPGRLEAMLNRNLPSASLTKTAAAGIYGLYSSSIKLDTENKEKGLLCASAGEKFKKSDTYTSTLLDSVTLVKKDEKLKLKADTEKSIAKLFDDHKHTDEGITKFKTAIDVLNEKIKSDNANPKELKDELHTLKGQLYKTMKAIHENEVVALKALFQTNEELTQQPDTTKDAIIDALKKSQQEQLTNFNKQVDAELRRMHSLTNQAEARILLCALMEKHGQNRDYSDKLFNEMIAKSNKSEMQISNVHNEGDRFSEADFKDLHEKGFTTKTGKTIKIFGEEGKKPGEIQIAKLSIKSGLFGGKLTSTDFLEMALLAKSMGWNTIKIEVYHSDPEKAKELAAEAYVACIKAGYPVGKFEVFLQNDKEKWVKQEPADLGVADPKSIESLLSTDERLPDEDNPTVESRKIVAEQRSQLPPAVTVTAPDPDQNSTPAAIVTGGSNSV